MDSNAAQEIARLKAELEQRDHDLKHLESKYKKLEKQNLDLQKSNEDLQHQIKVRDQADQALKLVMENYAPEALYTEYSGIVDPGLRLCWFIDYCKKILLQDKKLKKFLFGSGTTAPKTPDKPAEGGEGDKPEGNDDGQNAGNGEEGKDSDDSGKAKDKDSDLFDKLLEKADSDAARKKLILGIASLLIDKLDKLDDLDKLTGSLKGRGDDSSELKRRNEAKPSKGKKTNKGTLGHVKGRSELEKIFGRKLTKAQTNILQNWICPQCGAVGECSLRKMTKTMLDSFVAAGLVKTDDNGHFIITEERHDIVCKNCGYSEPEPDDNPAVLPGHYISLAVAVQSAIFYGSGFPVNAFENAFLSEAGLGHTTLLDAIHDVADLLYPFYKWAEEVVDNTPAAAADETTFNTCIDGTTKREYMCAKITQPGMWPAAVFFYPPGSRSKTSIVVDALKGGILSTDALKNYTKTPGVHQLCLAHLAVKCWESFEVRSKLGMRKFTEKVKNMTPEELRNLDLSKDDNALLALALVYYKLACVFAFESKAAENLGPKDGEKLFANRQELRSRYSAAIMGDIDYIFGELKKHYAVQCGTDKKTGLPLYQAVDRNNPICDPVVYWANSNGAFLSFLGEPMTSADNLNCYYETFPITKLCPQMAA